MSAARQPEGIDTGYDQGVFWRDGQGLIHFITDMSERYRINCCRFLIDKAADRYTRIRYRQEVGNWWSFVIYAADRDWGPANMDEEPTREEILRTVRKELDKGMHLDWMRAAPLFRAMALGLREDKLGPGVLAC